MTALVKFSGALYYSAVSMQYYVAPHPSGNGTIPGLASHLSIAIAYSRVKGRKREVKKLYYHQIQATPYISALLARRFQLNKEAYPTHIVEDSPQSRSLVTRHTHVTLPVPRIGLEHIRKFAFSEDAFFFHSYKQKIKLNQSKGRRTQD